MFYKQERDNETITNRSVPKILRRVGKFNYYFFMKKLKCIALAFLAISLVSCGGKKESETTEKGILKPVETEVSGDMDGCFKVIDKNYKIITDGWDKVITVEIERTDKDLPFNLDGRELTYYSGVCSSAGIGVGFGIEFLDADGNVLHKVAATEHSLYHVDADEFVALAKLKPGKKGTVRFKAKDVNEDEAVSFRIASAYVEKKGSDNSSTYSEEEESGEEPTTPSVEVILPSSLKGSVEIAYCSEAYKGSYGFPTIDIGFKLLKTVKTAPLASAYGQLWIVGVGQDENGRDVKELLPNYNEWRTGDSDGHEFKEFLESEPGETINMTFTGSDDGDVDAGLSKVKKFKLKITK